MIFLIIPVITAALMVGPAVVSLRQHHKIAKQHRQEQAERLKRGLSHRGESK